MQGLAVAMALIEISANSCEVSAMFYFCYERYIRAKSEGTNKTYFTGWSHNPVFET